MVLLLYWNISNSGTAAAVVPLLVLLQVPLPILLQAGSSSSSDLINYSWGREGGFCRGRAAPCRTVRVVKISNSRHKIEVKILFTFHNWQHISCRSSLTDNFCWKKKNIFFHYFLCPLHTITDGTVLSIYYYYQHCSFLSLPLLFSLIFNLIPLSLCRYNSLSFDTLSFTHPLYNSSYFFTKNRLWFCSVSNIYNIYLLLVWFVNCLCDFKWRFSF